MLPDENLDEMLENQEPLRWGLGVAFFSSEMDLVRLGRAAAPLFPWLMLFPVVAAALALVVVVDMWLAVGVIIDVAVDVTVWRL